MSRIDSMFWLGLVAASAGPYNAQANPRAQTVSFECRAMPLKRLLPKLSEKTGIHLEEEGDQKDDILVISAESVAVGDLMSAIAHSTSCKWLANPKGGYRLVQSSSDLARDDQGGRAERMRLIRAAIVKRLDRSTQEEKPKNNTVGPAPAVGAVSNSIFALLNATDMEAIAALEPNERVVFSTLPTAVQRTFSADPASSIASLIAAHNANVALRDSQLDTVPSVFQAHRDRASRPIGSIDKALVAVSRRSLLGFESLQANVRLIDTFGKLAFDETVDLRIAAEPSELEALQAQGGARSSQLDLADDTKQISQFYRSILRGVRSDRKLPPPLQEKISRPTEYDPLSFLATDEALALAKKWGRPIVANLSDDCSPLSDWLAQTPSLGGFERDLVESGPERVVPDPNWMLLRPRALAQTRRRRIDRSALEKLLTAAHAKPLVPLDDVAEYSLHAPSPLEGGFGALYVLSFVPGAFTLNPNALTSWEMLRIYGSFDPARRQALHGGDHLTLTDLNPYQIGQLRQMAFGALPRLEVDEEDTGAASSVPSYLKALVGGMFDDRRDEATEAFPDDIPLDGYLAVQSSDEFIAVAATTDGGVQPGPLSVMDIDTMALLCLARNVPLVTEAAPILGLPAWLKIGQRTLFSFTFQFSSPFSIRASLADNRFGTDSTLFTDGTLPARFRAALAARSASIKSSSVAAFGAMAIGALRSERSHPSP
jgi:hypothetical protein